MLTVSVAVPAVVPEIVTGLVIEHVGASETLELTAHVNDTAPLNPPPGVTVMVEVLPVVAPAATVIPPLSLSTTVGFGELTVTGTAVVAFAMPVPVLVTVTVYAPEVVAEVDVTVSVAVPAVAAVRVTGEVTEQVGPPLGATVQVNATGPLNPPEGDNVMVEVPLPPVAGSVMEPLLVSVTCGFGAIEVDTVTGTDVVNTWPLFVPVTVTTYVPVVVVDNVASDSVTVTGERPLTEAELAIVQVGAELAATGVTAQLRATAPVNPPTGVIVMVDMPSLPGFTPIAPLFVNV